MLRFELITVSVYHGVQKAYIKDLLLGRSDLVKVGDEIGGCKIVAISLAKKSVRLKPKGRPEFTIAREDPAA